MLVAHFLMSPPPLPSLASEWPPHEKYTSGILNVMFAINREQRKLHPHACPRFHHCCMTKKVKGI